MTSMRSQFAVIALTLLGTATAFGQGYGLSRISNHETDQNGHPAQGPTSHLELEFSGKVPPADAIKDVMKWSVRTYCLRDSGGLCTQGDSKEFNPSAAALSPIVNKVAILTLPSKVDFAAQRIVVTYLDANFPSVSSSEPEKGGVAKKFAPAKGSSDADLYLAGAVSSGVGTHPNYTVQAKAGYLFGLGRDGRYGSLGPASELALDTNVSSDPNHMKASMAYDKVIPLAPSAAAWIFHSNFIGGEFDKKGTTKNLVSDLSMRLVVPSFRLDTRTFTTADFLVGFEGGKNYEVPKGQALGSFDRKVLGVNGYYLLLRPGPLDRIALTGSYVLRLPSTAEPFVPAGATNPIFTTKPRHHAEANLNLMFSKAFGITAQYTWGSLPPLFSFVDHKVVLGLALQLKQAN